MNDLGAVHPDLHRLAAYALGRLAPEEMVEIEQHLAGCDACRKAVQDQPADTLISLLRARGTPVDPAGDAGMALDLPIPSSFVGNRPGTYDVPTQAVPVPSAAMKPPGELPADLLNHARYRVLEVLGSGGMGSVYRAEHRLMERPVALKVIRPDLVDNVELARRFQREVKTAARLSHPNIVAAYDAEQTGGTHMLVMEYVEGTDLDQLVKERGPLPAAEAADYVRQAALGLQYAAENGMVHRDIKPRNLMRTPSGKVKILDFGLARFASEAGNPAGELTASGMVLGSVDYIAPEQVDDPHSADTRADIYSLGCTLYHLLAGHSPYPTGSLIQKLKAHSERAPRSLGEVRPGLPPGLARVVDRMMAKEPARRFQTPAEVAQALAPFTVGPLDPDLAEPKPGSARPPRRPRVALLLASLLFGLVAFGVVYRIGTDKGELLIETDDPDVEVIVKQGGKLVTIVDPKTDQKVELRSGDYQVALEGKAEGLRLSTASFTLTRGETEIVRVRRIPAGVAPTATTIPMEPLRVTGPVRSLEGHLGSAEAVAVSPDGKTIVSASLDRTVRLWDAASGKEKRVFKEKKGELGFISVAFSPNGQYLAAGSQEGKLMTWDLVNGSEGWIERPGRVWSVAFSRDGKAIASAAGAPKSDRGDKAVPKPVTIWNPFELKEEVLIEEQVPTVLSLAFSPDGKTLATGGEDKAVTLWDVAAKTKRITIPLAKDARSLAFSPDGKTLAVGETVFKAVSLWDAATGKKRAEGFYHRGLSGGWSVAFSPDGTLLASAAGEKYDEPGEVQIWDAASGRELATLGGFGGGVRAVAFSPDGKTLITGELRGAVKVWDVTPRGPAAGTPAIGEVHGFKGHQGPVRSVAFSPDGRRVLSGSGFPSGDKTMRLWDVATGREIRRFTGPTDQVLSVAFLPDGKRGLSGGLDNSVRLWDLETGVEVRKFQGHTERINGLAVSPDGTRFLSAGFDKTVRLWEIETGRDLKRLDGHTGRVMAVAYFPDGKRALSSSLDGTARVWDLDTGKETSRFDVGGAIECAAVSPDGRRVLTGGGDAVVRVWDSETGKELRRYSGHQKAVLGIAFTPDGLGALSGGDDRSVRLWDVATGRDLSQWYMNQGAVWSVAVSPDGRKFVSGGGGEFRDGHWVPFVPGQDWTIRLWDLPPAKSMGP